MTYQASHDPTPSQAVLAALADPTRMALVERLRAGPQPVGRLASGLPVTRPAVSQHLKVLGDAGLVVARPDGTRRLYALRAEPLAELRAWIDGLWDDALTAFAARAKEIAEQEGKRP